MEPFTDTGAIDRFLEVFSRYIDSGFGLVRGDVASLAGLLVALDVTLAALFWTLGAADDVLARLIKKTLYVGFFAFLINDFHRLSQVVFESFAGLGLKASGAELPAAELLRPGRIAATGADAVRPLLEAAGELAGFPAIFENFVQIAVLLAAALVTLAAFFILAVQLFVTLVEFKLTTLAGFILVPFGLFGRTAFLAERVLGAVVGAGVKVLVLAVVTGIGGVLFEGFLSDHSATQPDLEQVLAIALGALCLLGLAIFVPALANGLVSGAPQLGAGAAAGSAAAAGGLAVVAGAGLRGAAGAASGLARAGGGRAPPGPPAAPPRPAGPGGGPAPSPGGSEAPLWARRLRQAQLASAGAAAAAHALRSGDSGQASLSVPLSEEKP